MSECWEENEISLKSQGGTEISKRTIAAIVPAELSDQFQVIPSRVRTIEQDKIRIYWQHDLAEDPEVNHLSSQESRDRFHKLIFSSNWQLEEFVSKLGIPQDEKVQVIETPIDPLPAVEKTFDEIRLVYFSTPQRGLELLVPVFEQLSKEFPNIHLDVFSSFKIYGWDEHDDKFRPLYDRIIQNPRMTYHGFTPQSELRQHLLQMHILAYPCIWKETSCRVLMESMSAGLMCVHPNLGALPDTSGGITTMYQFMTDPNKHANIFYHYMKHAISIVSKPEVQNYLGFVKRYADGRFNVTKISSFWTATMQDLLQRYPDPESRKPSTLEYFNYRT